MDGFTPRPLPYQQQPAVLTEAPVEADMKPSAEWLLETKAPWVGYLLLFQQYMLAFTREGVAPIRNLPQHGCCGRGPMDGFTPGF
ncbi:hypothetical protein ALT761_03739 [Alteromonas sp. 76-1]|uniref:hypothetical protein n=1 Tax=Alteromonas sp. 76-1 TaxID=2358187 RepID=UPI000FD185B0|nr:hypothetical protein [Alteromonas sp. 76-1]VEL98705.1 hypothetical protein ALT761_03739 [Alteromonas sp. 76-1]